MSCTSTVYMPNGKPAPVLLNEQELIHLLRLDEVDIKHPSETIKRYRETGRLRAVQISHRLFYRLESVLRFIEEQEGAVQR